MLRLATQVTTSPTSSRRSWSASSATARTSGPRAENRVTISSSPTSWPEATAGQHLGHRAAGAGRGARGRRSRRPAPRQEPAGSASTPPEHHAVLASEALGVGAVEDGEAHGRVEPALGVEGELGVDGEARRQGQAGRLGRRRAGASSAGQARSGLTWSAVTGETPPQSSMPESSSGPRSSERLGGAWTWTSGGSTSRATAIVQHSSLGRARRVVVHGRARLGQEVLDDHLLDVAVAPVGVGDGLQGARPARPAVSPMPTRMPVVKGMASSPAASKVASRRSRGLVGSAPVARQVGVERLEHHPLAGRDRAQAGQLVVAEGAGVGVGEQPGLVAHQRRTWRPGSRRSRRTRGRSSQAAAAG